MCEGTRYSLTFRSISRRNKSDTCIIADSNTAGLAFVDDPSKSFGSALPGKRFAEPLLKDVNPLDTCGYTNVVIMAGINDYANPEAHIFVCPVLPTMRKS